MHKKRLHELSEREKKFIRKNPKGAMFVMNLMFATIIGLTGFLVFSIGYTIYLSFWG